MKAKFKKSIVNVNCCFLFFSTSVRRNGSIIAALQLGP